MMTKPIDVRGAKTCPICGKLAVPFCSKRCADVDLNRWLSGVYAVPVVEEDGAEDKDDAAKPEEERR
jgi:endogenous inhibitor of DNA gyrase (YacG/DUF329 family)